MAEVAPPEVEELVPVFLRPAHRGPVEEMVRP
jgi:hypothetical protein